MKYDIKAKGMQILSEFGWIPRVNTTCNSTQIKKQNISSPQKSPFLSPPPQTQRCDHWCDLRCERLVSEICTLEIREHVLFHSWPCRWDSSMSFVDLAHSCSLPCEQTKFMCSFYPGWAHALFPGEGYHHSRCSERAGACLLVNTCSHSAGVTAGSGARTIVRL